MLIKLIFLTTVITSALAKLDIGTCVEGLSGQIPFNMEMFAGEWFLKHSLDNENQRCISWKFNYDNSTTNPPSNQYTVHTSGINIKSSRVEVKDGIAKWKDYKQEESELLVSFKNDVWGQSARNYVILATDFNSYALVYTCTKTLWVIRTRNLWILTRDRNLIKLNPTILIYLDALKIKPSEMNEVGQDFCM